MLKSPARQAREFREVLGELGGNVLAERIEIEVVHLGSRVYSLIGLEGERVDGGPLKEGSRRAVLRGWGVRAELKLLTAGCKDAISGVLSQLQELAWPLSFDIISSSTHQQTCHRN